MSELNEQQMGRFNAVNARLGLAPAQSTHATNARVKDFVAKQHVVLSSNPAESDIPPYLIAVGSIAELNKLAGAPDDGDDTDVVYPPAASAHLTAKAEQPLTRAQLIGSLDDDTLADLKTAAAAYLKGNPAKVADYEPLINATLFPGKVAVFADSGDLNVPENGSVTIKGADPVVLNYGSITVGQNGQIIVQTDANITTQIMTQL
ncbi:hypothetical protein [Parapedobacter indicus]|uniref:Uncharacterized protein n=1 Tax=Parapedobacter indicus TaxID=1477437 RepID=A0A1I3HNL3_9SPHI|nr:hypothetical protein [Parapedobacter indicus]PPL03110.1 hypothetical protein CLV26_103436 [Parapedobacter indicus]SFI37325.1 hypothetical protein SAMN05444682_103435 [Parapedobacter indicus]